MDQLHIVGKLQMDVKSEHMRIWIYYIYHQQKYITFLQVYLPIGGTFVAITMVRNNIISLLSTIIPLQLFYP